MSAFILLGGTLRLPMPGARAQGRAGALSRITGVEISETMVSQVGRRLRGGIESGRLALVAGDVASLPLHDRCFDRALCVHMIYFWPDPVRALAEVCRVLRPGSRLVLGFAAKDHMQERWFARHGYHRLYTDDEVRLALEAAGFEDVRIEADDFSRAAHGRRPS